MGIWQWYFLDPHTARDKCQIKDEHCTVTDKGATGKTVIINQSELRTIAKRVQLPDKIASLFNTASLKEKFGEVKAELEHRLHMPFARIAAIGLGAMAAVIGTLRSLSPLIEMPTSQACAFFVVFGTTACGVASGDRRATVAC